jgi:hypothetical protein
MWRERESEEGGGRRRGRIEGQKRGRRGWRRREEERGDRGTEEREEEREERGRRGWRSERRRRGIGRDGSGEGGGKTNLGEYYFSRASRSCFPHPPRHLWTRPTSPLHFWRELRLPPGETGPTFLSPPG